MHKQINKKYFSRKQISPIRIDQKEFHSTISLKLSTTQKYLVFAMNINNYLSGYQNNTNNIRTPPMTVNMIKTSVRCTEQNG